MSNPDHNPELPTAVTMGDPAGIGPDITLMAWNQRHAENLAPFVFIGDEEVLKDRAEGLGIKAKIAPVNSPREAASLFHDALPVMPVSLPCEVKAGEPHADTASAILESIERAVGMARNRDVAAVVTNPINKMHLSASGFSHTGHTDFLAELCTPAGGIAPRPVMMLANQNLRVVPVTVHIPLREVPDALTSELIVETATITSRELEEKFGIGSPRLAITGLNPHAGDGGLLGHEEAEIIEPAIAELKSLGLDVSGPLAADAAFQERLRGSYDAVLAMYHDQALIPVKTLAFDKTVNITLGLPIIRTSPDHGTAYALAGSGKANAGSMIASLKLAAQLSTRELEAA